MPRYAYLATGSNQIVKTGSGQVYGLAVGSNAGTIVVVDSDDLGATPNLITQISNSSNILYWTGGQDSIDLRLWGVPFNRGLAIAATSNAPITVFFD